MKYKKTITTIWFSFILLILAFFISFISYLISGEKGTTIATIQVLSVENNRSRGTIRYKGEIKQFEIKGEMIGVEAFQLYLKPYMQIFFGRKRLVLTSLFGEIFSENYTKGEVRYYPVRDFIFNKKKLWARLQRKSLLLFGVKGVQRKMVSVYPEKGKSYVVKVGSQGLLMDKQ